MVNVFDVAGGLRSSLKSNTKLVWLEVCTNPLIMVADLEAVIKAVKDFNPDIVVGIDNTFLSPYILVYWYIGGFGRKSQTNA
jgi:cystathionine gamma-synthase